MKPGDINVSAIVADECGILARKIKRMKKLLEKLQWRDGGIFCPICSGEKHEGHQKNCQLWKEITAPGG